MSEDERWRERMKWLPKIDGELPLATLQRLAKVHGIPRTRQIKGGKKARKTKDELAKEIRSALGQGTFRDRVARTNEILSHIVPPMERLKWHRPNEECAEWHTDEGYLACRNFLGVWVWGTMDDEGYLPNVIGHAQTLREAKEAAFEHYVDVAIGKAKQKSK